MDRKRTSASPEPEADTDKQWDGVVVDLERGDVHATIAMDAKAFDRFLHNFCHGETPTIPSAKPDGDGAK